MDQGQNYGETLRKIEDQDKKIGDCDHPKDQRSYPQDNGTGHYVKSVCNICTATIYEPRQR